MKIAVISDTHREVKYCIDALKNVDNIDLIIHLGDYTKDVATIKEAINIEVIKVKGNCDVHDINTTDEEIIEIKGKRIFLTHGDLYRVKHGLNNLYYKAKEVGADVVLFGHSHTATVVEHDGILFLNPGSPSLPRAGTNKSIGILNIDESVSGEILHIY